MIDPGKILEDLTGRHAALYVDRVQDLLVALVTNNRPAAADARAALAKLTAETMGVGEVLGASLMLRAAAGMPELQAAAQQRFPRADFARLRGELLRFEAEPSQNILPRVTLTEALQDLIDRTPVTIRRAAERTAQRIAELYTEDRVVAFVRAAEASVTRTAQDYLARAFREGLGETAAGRGLALAVNEIRKRSADWSASYGRMVFRTNVNTAVTAGRFRQARDPDIKAVVPAFRFDAVGDGDTRDNHGAADGIILSVDNPEWARIAPPLGYNCRCQVSHVTRVELQLAGRIGRDGRVIESRVPSSAFPDAGFRHGGRPDLFLTGATL